MDPSKQHKEVQSFLQLSLNQGYKNGIIRKPLQLWLQLKYLLRSLNIKTDFNRVGIRDLFDTGSALSPTQSVGSINCWEQVTH